MPGHAAAVLQLFGAACKEWRRRRVRARRFSFVLAGWVSVAVAISLALAPQTALAEAGPTAPAPSAGPVLDAAARREWRQKVSDWAKRVEEFRLHKALKTRAQTWQRREDRARHHYQREITRLRSEMPLQLREECGSHPDNASWYLLRCAVAKAVDPEYVYSQEVQTRLTWQALAYIGEIRNQGRTLPQSHPINPHSDTALTRWFFEERTWMMSQGGTYPRVYVLEEWDSMCDEVDLGYWYYLESWMYQFFKKPNMAVIDDVTAADFVYLPLCIRRMMNHYTEIELQAGRVRSFLPYEAALLRLAVLKTDQEYMLKKIEQWSTLPAFAHCMERESCRFLTTSIDGRHVYLNTSQYFGSKAVYITHMGMSNWSAVQKGNLFWTDVHFAAPQAAREPGDGAGAVSGSQGGAWTPLWSPPEDMPPGCRAACPLHCRLEPPGVLPDDIVVPWSVGYAWTRRSFEFHSRDIFAFFSGSESSCARRVMLRVLRPLFVTAVHGNGSAGRDLRRAVLAFPVHVKLEQPVWSEIAFRSKVCLVPDGDCTATGRLIEVMLHGCIPVIITNRLLPPMEQYIAWRKIAFFVREDEIAQLPRILSRIAEQPNQLVAMHRRLHDVSRFLDFNRQMPEMLVQALWNRAQTFRRPTHDGWGG